MILYHVEQFQIDGTWKREKTFTTKKEAEKYKGKDENLSILVEITE